MVLERVFPSIYLDPDWLKGEFMSPSKGHKSNCQPFSSEMIILSHSDRVIE